MFLSNAHTHSTYCDGKNPPREMLEAVRRLGFVSLGYSSHSEHGVEGSPSAMTVAKQEAYLADVRALQKETQDLRIWVGLEADALCTPEAIASVRQSTDYFIGSTHYVRAEGRSDIAAVDGPAERLVQYIADAFAGDGLAMAQRYFDIQRDFLLREKPPIIGHFDLLRKYAASYRLFDEESAAYRKMALNALEASFPCGGVLEINTGGIARGYLPLPYPTLELLCAWREMGGKVTITSDCHNAEYLTCAYDLAEELVHKAGFRSLMRLGTGDCLWEEIEA